MPPQPHMLPPVRQEVMMDRVVTVEGEEGGGSEVGSCGKAQAFAVVGAVQLMMGWRLVSRGMVSGTVPLSIKATVKLVQVVGQAWVVSGVGGSRLTVGNQPKPFPDRSRVIG